MPPRPRKCEAEQGPAHSLNNYTAMVCSTIMVVRIHRFDYEFMCNEELQGDVSVHVFFQLTGT